MKTHANSMQLANLIFKFDAPKIAYVKSTKSLHNTFNISHDEYVEYKQIIRMYKILRGGDTNIIIWCLQCDLSDLKLIESFVFVSAFSMFEMQVQTGTAFSTNGCGHCGGEEA